MAEGPPPLKEQLRLRITVARLDAVFEACNSLPQNERDLFYAEMAKRLLQHAPQAISKVPSNSPASTVKTLEAFVERCRGLADSAPNEKVRNALQMIVRFCEAEETEAAVKR